MGYTALIRTFNCRTVLTSTLSALSAQSLPPGEYVFVDSGSTDGTLAVIPPGSVVRPFVGTEFNYSDALNQGIQAVSSDYVLIISSHTELGDSRAIEQALQVLREDPSIGAAYFCNENSGRLRYEIIGPGSFTGFNGLWNTCSIVRTALVKKRPFRREVFTAEDQEWTRWLLHEEGKTVARFAGAHLRNNNPRKSSLRKRVNEYVSIAYFSKRELLHWRNLVDIAWRIVNPGGWPAVRERMFNLTLLGRLLACHVARPRTRSRYF